MLKKIFISAVLLIAVLSFVVSLLGGNNNNEPKVAVGDRVAVINISGPIVDGASVEQTLFGGTQAATSGQLMKEIREAAADSSVKALVLHINSPGGSVTAAEEVGRELERFKETTKKPIVTSMGDQAASAAYWLASYSDVIYANSSTLTGSIGVYMPYMNVEDLYKKIGVYIGKIKSGPHKDILSPDREMTAEEREILQGIVNQLYDEFIAVVANGRKMDTAAVRALADGRVYTGKQAQQLGLVDEIGNYYDALEAAGKLIGVNGIPEIKEKQTAKPWQILFEARLSELILSQFENALNGAAADMKTVPVPKAER